MALDMCSRLSELRLTFTEMEPIPLINEEWLKPVHLFHHAYHCQARPDKCTSVQQGMLVYCHSTWYRLLQVNINEGVLDLFDDRSAQAAFRYLSSRNAYYP